MSSDLKIGKCYKFYGTLHENFKYEKKILHWIGKSIFDMQGVICLVLEKTRLDLESGYFFLVKVLVDNKIWYTVVKHNYYDDFEEIYLNE